MTYAYDDYVQMPTKDLYDTAVMKMAIEAAKDMYDKGQALMENFYKTYGDFMSPFAKDMEVYGNAMNNVRKTINDAYARGIDLFKSPEGRMIVSQLSHSVDPLWYNSARLNAKIGYAYLDAAAKLRAAGKYSEALELYDIMKNDGTAFGDFSTIDPKTNTVRIWNRPSPIEAVDLRSLTAPYYSTRTARNLTKEDVESIPGYKYDSKYNWTGYLQSDLLAAAPGIVNSLAADPRFGFFVEQAKQQAKLANPGATDEQLEALAIQQLYNNIAESGKGYIMNPKKEADQYELDDYRTKNDDWLDAQKSARDYDYKVLEYADTNGDRKVSSEERAEYAKMMRDSKLKGTGNSVFESARTYGSSGYNPDERVDFDLIDPVNPNIKNDYTKDKKRVYTIPNSELDNAELYDEDGNAITINSDNIEDFGEGSDIYFVPSGELEYGENMVKRGSTNRKSALADIPNDWYGEPQYYIYGRIKYKNKEGATADLKDNNGNPVVIKMRVKERPYRNGKK